MSDRLSFSRRQFVRLAALAGSLSLAAGFPGKVAAAAAAPSVAAASPAAKPFTNGIDPPTYVGGDGLFVPSGDPANLHSWADRAGKRVGVGLGVNYQDWLQRRDDLGELLAYKDQTETAADLVAGRVDVYVAEDANFTGFLKQNPNLPIESVPDYVPQSDLADWTRFGVRKDDRDLNNVLSHAFGEMFIDGTTLGILKKYGLGERNLFAIKGMHSG